MVSVALVSPAATVDGTRRCHVVRARLGGAVLGVVVDRDRHACGLCQTYLELDPGVALGGFRRRDRHGARIDDLRRRRPGVDGHGAHRARRFEGHHERLLRLFQVVAPRRDGDGAACRARADRQTGGDRRVVAVCRCRAGHRVADLHGRRAGTAGQRHRKPCGGALGDVLRIGAHRRGQRIVVYDRSRRGCACLRQTHARRQLVTGEHHREGLGRLVEGVVGRGHRDRLRQCSVGLEADPAASRGVVRAGARGTGDAVVRGGPGDLHQAHHPARQRDHEAYRFAFARRRHRCPRRGGSHRNGHRVVVRDRHRGYRLRLARRDASGRVATLLGQPHCQRLGVLQHAVIERCDERTCPAPGPGRS